MDERDQETFERFAERYAAIDQVVPSPRPLAAIGPRPSVVGRVALSVGSAIAVLFIAVVILGRAPASPPADLPPAAPTVEPSISPVPSLGGGPRDLEGTPPGWFSVRPHVWTVPVGPRGFYANVPIADPCPTELLSDEACRKPLSALPADGVLVTISATAILELPKNLGQIDTTRAFGVCASLGGDVEMTAPLRGGFMDACIRGPKVAEAAATVRAMVAAAMGRAPAASTSLPPGIGREQAIELARPHVAPDWSFLAAEAGAFAQLDTHPSGTGPGSDVKPTDLVWAVTFTGEMTICPPNGDACFSPRPGLLVVYLDYRSGAFRMSAGSAPP